MVWDGGGVVDPTKIEYIEFRSIQTTSPPSNITYLINQAENKKLQKKCLPAM